MVRARAPRDLALGSAAFAATIVVSFLTHLSIPFVIEPSLMSVYAIALTYAALSVPFIFSGIVVSLALTQFPRQVSALYGADLAGAALGCVLVGPLLRLTDGPTAVLATAAVAALGALLFAAELPSRRLMRTCAALAVLLTVGASAHAVAARRNAPWLRLVWVKGVFEARPLVEKWNSFSRVRVIGNPDRPIKPSGWGLSATLPAGLTTRELHMDIDSYAGTEITAYSGDPAALEHLKYDVTNVAHYLRPDSRVIVVGTGGGRDILSALAFGQRGGHRRRDQREHHRASSTAGSATSPAIWTAIRGCRFVNDEARSFIARSDERADIMQISLIDTWAATASGAFVLTESSFYTVEAWRTFLDHLAPRGILSVSRWYYAERPGEVYRLATLASTTLAQMGVSRPGDHFAIVRARPPHAAERAGRHRHAARVARSAAPIAISTRSRRSPPGCSSKWSRARGTRPIRRSRTSRAASGSPPHRRASAEHRRADRRPAVLLLHAPAARRLRHGRGGATRASSQFNMAAVGVLGVLFVTVLVLTALCIGLPLLFSSARRDLTGAGPHLLFFAAIGFGFMLVEISQVQRLAIFLGHPVYSLSVVLFSLLLSSGAGSVSTGRMPGGAGRIAIGGRPARCCSWSSWWRSGSLRLPPCGTSRRPRPRCAFSCR